MKTINQQTPGPIVLINGALYAPDAETEIAQVSGPNLIIRGEEKFANRCLLAASYTAFDKAGRELGIDATELAKTINLTALIRLLRFTTEGFDIGWKASQGNRPSDISDDAHAMINAIDKLRA